MEGVAQLHRSGLIHRGICPDNILLPIDGTARLTGYGTLALRTGGSELKSQLYPGYAAPEQYSAAEFSGRYTDVYALAAVCYKMVTGQTPVAAPQRRVRQPGIRPQPGSGRADLVFPGAGLRHAAGSGQAYADRARIDERPD